MAISQCPKCDGHYFELKLTEISGAAFKFYFVQCSKCGAVVGTQPFNNTEALIRALAKKLKVKLD
jgi:hypothetical protein